MNIIAPELRTAARSTVTPGTIILVTSADPSLREHRGDDLFIHPGLGRLIQPRHTSSIERTATAGIPWAADNDCFQGLDEVAYVRMLDRIVGLPGCLFVTVPDVVGDSAATAELFERWIGELDRRGLPAALVAQDGLRSEDVPWDRIRCLFIGGTTEFKLGEEAAELAREAIRRGKLVHWGRVNSRRRFDYIVSTGAATSFDGSKWARFRKTYLDGGLAWTLETVAPLHFSPSSRYDDGVSKGTDRKENTMTRTYSPAEAAALPALAIGTKRSTQAELEAEVARLGFQPLEFAESGRPVLEVGDLVVAHSRGSLRVCQVESLGRTNATLVYTTQGAWTDAEKIRAQNAGRSEATIRAYAERWYSPTAGWREDTPEEAAKRKDAIAKFIARELASTARADEHGAAAFLNVTRKAVAYTDLWGRKPSEVACVETAGRYEVKCDECKSTIRRTDSLAESARGGRCPECAPAPEPLYVRSLEHAGRPVLGRYIRTDEDVFVYEAEAGGTAYAPVDCAELVSSPPLGEAATIELRLPGRFYDDHRARDLPAGEFVRWAGRSAIVRLDRPTYDELLSDARHYADPSMDFDDRGLVSSARATVRALEAVNASVFAGCQA